MNFDLELLGLWSADALYGPGAQSDEMVAFKNDGSGWLEISNFGMGQLDEFQWTPTSPGWICLNFTRSFELGHGGRVCEIESAKEVLHLPFSVTLEIAPNEREMRVLRCEITPLVDNVFGFVKAEVSRPWNPPQNTSA